MPGTLKLKSEAGGSVILAANTTAASDYTVTVPPFAGTMATLVANTTGPVFSVPNVAGNGPAFSVFSNAQTSCSNNTNTKITLNQKTFDTSNAFDATTNYRFQPTVAGYYQFNASMLSVPTTGAAQMLIWKNGTTYTNGIQFGNNSASTILYAGCLMYMNGTTDYAELYMWQNSGSTANMGSSNATYSFSGFLVRSA